MDLSSIVILGTIINFLFILIKLIYIEYRLYKMTEQYGDHTQRLLNLKGLLHINNHRQKIYMIAWIIPFANILETYIFITRYKKYILTGAKRDMIDYLLYLKKQP